MAYQITFTTTFADGAPPYDVWIESQPSSIFTGDIAIQAAGKTPAQILASRMTSYTDPAKGFISSTVTTEGNINRLVELWESQEDVILARKSVIKDNPVGTIAGAVDSNVITGTGTTFTTDVAVGSQITEITDRETIIGIVKSIESNTSLTLINPLTLGQIGVENFSGLSYRVDYPSGPADFLYQTYANTYIVSIDVTTANI